MKKYYLTIIVGLLLIISSCTNNNSEISAAPLTNIVEKDNTFDLLKESRLNTLKLKYHNGDEDITWESFYENYKETALKNHEDKSWRKYISSLLSFQILETPMLENINSENYDILQKYLEELSQLKSGYTKLNYLLIDKLQAYDDTQSLIPYAKSSIDKALAGQSKAKAHLDGLPEKGELYRTMKEKVRKKYEEDYGIYLPKLKEFLVQSQSN